MTDDFFKPDLPENTVFHVGVSGGKDSTAVLLWMIHESGVPKEKITASFCDTGNEHDYTLAQIKLLNDTVHPISTILPDLGFYDLVRKKGVFPSNSRRFCTQHLKIIPTSRYIRGLAASAECIVAVSGVRADESFERRELPEWDLSQSLLTLQWRPMIKWTLADVIAIHEKHGIPLNPLYSEGAKRVGCFPCIYSRKAEVRNVSRISPERIDMIRDVETEMGAQGKSASFFHANTVPLRFRTKPYTKEDGTIMMVASIDDVVRWSKTGRGAKGSYLDDSEVAEKITCASGFCE